MTDLTIGEKIEKLERLKNLIKSLTTDIALMKFIYVMLLGTLHDPEASELDSEWERLEMFLSTHESEGETKQ